MVLKVSCDRLLHPVTMVLHPLGVRKSLDVRHSPEKNEASHNDFAAGAHISGLRDDLQPLFAKRRIYADTDRDVLPVRDR